MKDVSEESTARSLTSDLAKSGIEVSKKTITRNGLQGCRPKKPTE